MRLLLCPNCSRLTAILVIAAVVSSASTAQSATVAYWEFDGGLGDALDSVGSQDLVLTTGAGGSSAALVNPVPNPDSSLPWNNSSDDSTTNAASSSFSGTVYVQPNSNVEWLDPPTNTIPNPAKDDTFRIRWDKPFTIEGWIRVTSTGTGYVVGNRGGDSTTNFGGNFKGWSINSQGGGTDLNFFLDAGSGSGKSIGLLADDALTLNQTHHFAGVFDASNFELRLYVDGVEKASAPTPAGWLSDAFERGGALAIGGRNAGSGYNSAMFGGQIDEIRYSDVALSPTEFLNFVIPEPTTALLSAFAGVVLMSCRKRNQL